MLYGSLGVAAHLESNPFACRVSADAGDNQGSLANLALKGIIGVRAMAEINTAVGMSNDSVRYLVSRRAALHFGV